MVVTDDEMCSAVDLLNLELRESKLSTGTYTLIFCQ